MGSAAFHWIFADSAELTGIEGDAVSAWGRFLDGSVQILPMGSDPLDPHWQALLEEWPTLSFDNFLPLVIDGSADGGVAWTFADALDPVLGLAYDAAATIALAFCDAGGPSATAASAHASLLNLDFEGASGRVAFDEFGSRTPETSRYAVTGVAYSVDVILEQPQVGMYFASRWNFSSPVHFYGGALTPPSDGLDQVRTPSASAGGEAGAAAALPPTVIIVQHDADRAARIVLFVFVGLIACGGVAFCV